MRLPAAGWFSFRVGPARKHVGDGARGGVLGLERGAHRVDELAVECRLDPVVEVNPLTLDVRSEDRIKRRLEVGLAPRQEAAVDGCAGGGWDDVGLVTFVLDQTYQMDGQQQTISAPTSVVLVRHDGDWKIALIHTVLPNSYIVGSIANFYAAPASKAEFLLGKQLPYVAVSLVERFALLRRWRRLARTIVGPPDDMNVRSSERDRRDAEQSEARGANQQ